MAQILVSNKKFTGIVRVCGGQQIQFRAEGRKNWNSLTGLSRKGRIEMSFGRYGRFDVQKRSVLTLDEVVDRLFDRAKALRNAAA